MMNISMEGHEGEIGLSYETVNKTEAKEKP